MVLGLVDRAMASDERDDGWLVALYRRYLGEPVEKTDVFIGFGLFFGGLTFGVVGLVMFLASGTVSPGDIFRWQLREIAIVSAFLGLPGFVLSIVVLLPVAKRAVHASIGGTIVCGSAVAVFIATYPQAWNVPGRDYSPLGIAVYAVGLAILVASTGAALVAHHLEEGSAGRTAGSPEAGPREQTDPGDSVTAAEVQRDIESAVADADLTWGGVERSATRHLELDTESTADLDTSGFAAIGPEATSTGGGKIDDAVEGLKKLRGWEPETATGQGVDDQTTALSELRASADEDEAGGDNSLMGGLLARFRDR